MTRPEDIDQGPHPDSRLVREEDELGEGDDGLCPLLSDVLWSLLCWPADHTPEFAEYTSARERIALGKKATRKAAVDRRETMKELIADAYVTFSWY